jgi:hypothetical protein
VARKYDFYATFIIDTPVAILPSGIFIVVITAVPVTTGEDSVTVAIASRGLFDVGGAFLATIIDTCTHGGFWLVQLKGFKSWINKNRQRLEWIDWNDFGYRFKFWDKGKAKCVG